MKLVFHLLIIVFVGFFTNGYSQLDSLYSALLIAEKNTDKSTINYKIANLLKYENPDSALTLSLEGLRLASESDFSIGLAENAAVAGDVYIIKDDLENAKLNFLISQDNFKISKKHFDYAQISMILGNIYLTQGKYLKSLKIYQECLITSKENNFEDLIPHIVNNLGVLFLRIENYSEANIYFKEASLLFQKDQELYSSTICLMNIAVINSVQGNDSIAMSEFFEVIRILSEQKSWVDIAICYNHISQIYFKNDDLANSQEYLNLALNILENNKTTFEGPASLKSSNIYTNASKLYFRINDFKKALDFARKSLKLSKLNLYNYQIYENAKLISQVYEQYQQPDSVLFYYKLMMKYSELNQKESNIKQITQLRMQYEFDALLKQKELTRIKNEALHSQKVYRYKGLLVFVFLIAVIIILMWVNQRILTAKSELREEKLELEKRQLNSELLYKNKELTTNMMYLVEKNEFITLIAKKLTQIRNSFSLSNQKIVLQIIAELKQNSTTEVWKEFELRFKEVHNDFYKALNSEFPELSPNEKRLCAFLKLNMTTKEISIITHQSIKSINMARFRLRKKMNLDQEDNLIAYLAQL